MAEGYVNDILIPYDCIIEQDIGLFNVIREKYSNDVVFDMEKIQDEESCRELVLNNKYKNPLELILRPDYSEKKEDFYSQFIEMEYENILDKAPNTLIYEMARKLMNSKMGNITFLVSNDYERDKLFEIYDQSILIDIVDSYENYSVKNFDIVFIRRFEDFLKFKNLEGKHLYILDYTFNLENNRNDEEMIPIVPYSIIAYSNSNIINLVSVYRDDEEENENDF